MGVVLMILPLMMFAQLVPCGMGDSQCTLCHLWLLISNVINFILRDIVLPVSVIAIIIAGILFITAGGSESQIGQAKSVFTGVVWGIVIAFGAWLIVDTIMKSLASGEFSGAWNQFPSCN